MTERMIVKHYGAGPQWPSQFVAHHTSTSNGVEVDM